MKPFSTTEANPNLRSTQRERRDDGSYCHGQEKKVPCCSSHKSPNSKSIKPVSGNVQLFCTCLEKTGQNKSLCRKYKEQPKNTIGGTEYTVRKTDNRIQHQKLISTLLKFQRSLTKIMSRKQHQVSVPSRK